MASHLFYHAGRVITYALLGAALGLTGSFTGLTANIAGLQRGVMIATGIIIMIMGAAMTDSLPCPRIFAAKFAPSAFMSRIFQRLPHTTSPAAHFPIGLMLGLLPCGPVYTALIAAARAGMSAAGGLHGAMAGAGIMVSFGMGTVPALLLVAKLSDLGWLKARRLIYGIGGVLMILVGGYYVVMGLRF